MGQGTRWPRGAGSHGAHSSASLPLCPTYSTVPTGCEQMVSKLTGCKQLCGASQGIRYCLHAFSLGNKRCLPAQKICWETLVHLLLLGFFFEALLPSSDRSGLMPVRLYKLPALTFSTFPLTLCSWKETTSSALVQGTSPLLFKRAADTPLLAKIPSFHFPSNSYTP